MTAVESASLRAVVRGRVQGVFFRDFVRRWAYQLKLSGYVRNLPDGDVEVVAEGEKPDLDKLLAFLQEGPPAASVEDIQVYWGKPTAAYSEFSVRY